MSTTNIEVKQRLETAEGSLLIQDKSKNSLIDFDYMSPETRMNTKKAEINVGSSDPM